MQYDISKYVTPFPILVVDDDPTHLLMCKTMLEPDGHTVLDASSGAEAIELFRQYSPALAILDVMMPEMDGYELSEKLLSMKGGENLTVLIATALNEDVNIERAFRAGAADCISKPVNWTALKGRINHLQQKFLIEQLIRKTEEQLRQSKKMHAIENLSAGIAHEFNNILGGIMGYTELMHSHLERLGEEKLLRYASEIRHATNRASNLVHQMQLFSQARPGEQQHLDAKILVKGLMRNIRSQLAGNIELTLQLEDDLPPIKCDIVQFEKMLANVIFNARDAIEEFGSINISLKQISIVNSLCSSCYQNFNGKFIQLSIQDSGKGIAPDLQEKIFQPYFTTKAVGRGVGLGLSVVHGIMHDTNGHIIVHSNTGEGTCISLLFPLSDSRFENRKNEFMEQDSTPADIKNQHILLVDDETAITGYLSELLEMHAYKVTSCNDSSLALEIFSAAPASYDLVVTDMSLPGMSGIELAAKILQLHADIPVILCSGYIDEKTRQLIKTTGIRAAFNKPVNSITLINSIKQLLQSPS